jgi:hypothetical protein
MPAKNSKKKKKRSKKKKKGAGADGQTIDRDALLAFYQTFCPEKAVEIDDTLEKMSPSEIVENLKQDYPDQELTGLLVRDTTCVDTWDMTPAQKDHKPRELIVKQRQPTAVSLRDTLVTRQGNIQQALKERREEMHAAQRKGSNKSELQL